MKILIDMNLSPDWREVFAKHDWESVHWSSVGKPTAPDKTILQYARDNGYIVLTHDLDFSAILAATGAKAPSVIQVRAQDVLSERFEKLVISSTHCASSNRRWLPARWLLLMKADRGREFCH